MPWGAVAGAVVGSVANKALNSDKNGGAGTQTQTNSKEPWAAAQPWLLQNMATGQAMQQQLQAQPFNAQQQQAYANQYAQSDYMRNLVPSLLNQMQGQQVGFDKANPDARQTAWDWNATTGLAGAGANAGSMVNAAAAQAAADAAAKAKKPSGDFTNFDIASNPMAGYYGAYLGMANQFTDGGAGIKDLFKGALGDAGGAGYGDFKYGQDLPKKGTQGWRDMQEYFAYGGSDPFNLYGKMDAGTAAGGLLGST